AKKCPSGLHWMDPTLKVCPHCATSNRDDQNDKPPLAIHLASQRKNSVLAINPFGICRDLTQLHSGRMFDVYESKLGNTKVCLKTPRPPRPPAENQRAETALYECFETDVRILSEIYGQTNTIARPGEWESTLFLQTETEIVRAT